MQILLIKPGHPPLLRRGLDHLIKGLMNNRANRAAPLEDREADKETIDAAVALKKVIGEIGDDEGATLIVGGAGPGPTFPGLMQIDQACDELFGVGCVPQLLEEAIAAHTGTLAVGMASAASVGEMANEMMTAARELLEELGEGSAVDVGPQASRLREAVDNVEACFIPNAVTQEMMDAAVERARKWMPGLSSWVATVLHLRDKRVAKAVPDLTEIKGATSFQNLRDCVDQGTSLHPNMFAYQALRELLSAVRPEAVPPIEAPYGVNGDGSPKKVEDCE